MVTQLFALYVIRNPAYVIILLKLGQCVLFMSSSSLLGFVGWQVDNDIVWCLIAGWLG